MPCIRSAVRGIVIDAGEILLTTNRKPETRS